MEATLAFIKPKDKKFKPVLMKQIPEAYIPRVDKNAYHTIFFQEKNAYHTLSYNFIEQK